MQTLWEPVPSEVMRRRERLPGNPGGRTMWPRTESSPTPALTAQCQWGWTYIGRAVAPMLFC
eukprot:12908706-Prorocentrum_lima.AAC.1